MQDSQAQFLLAAVDVNDRAPHGAARDHAAHAGDREERKQQDFDDLVDTAMQKAGSRKALVPSKSKKKMQEVDLRQLTRSKRQLVIEQALQVCCLRCAACTTGPSHCCTSDKLYPGNKHCRLISLSQPCSNACDAEQGRRPRKILWQAQGEDAEV